MFGSSLVEGFKPAYFSTYFGFIRLYFWKSSV